MFTFQILDRGQTFLVPLADRPLLLGADPVCDIRLEEVGVLPQHARIEPQAGGARLVALAGPVRVNGTQVRDWTLALGDRLEVGASVLVVGRSVVRATSAEDVVAEGRAMARARAPRPPARSPRWLPIAGALLVGGTVAAFTLLGGGGGGLGNFSGLDRLRRNGSFAAAHAEIERLRVDWAQGDAEKLRLLAEQEHRVQVTEGAVTARRDAVLASGEQTYAQISDQLRREERQAGVAGEAARIVRASLTEILAARPRPAAPAVATSPASVPEVPVAPTPTSGGATTVESGALDHGMVAGLLDDAARLQREGMFRQALDALQAALAQAPAAEQERVRGQLAAARAEACAARDVALASARALAEQGRLEAAAEHLGQSAHRFPDHADFASLGSQQRGYLERAAAAARGARVAASKPSATPVVDEQARTFTLASLQSLLDRIRAAETGGDFGGAASLLREGAALVAARDADYASRLRTRAEECERIGGLHAAVVQFLQGGRKIEVALRSGRLGLLHGVDGGAILGDTTDGPQRLTLLDLTADGLGKLIDEGKLGTPAALGAATLLYRNGEAPQAESLLARALKTDPGGKPAIDLALAAGRGDQADPRGYTLRDGVFVSARQLDSEKASVRLLAQLQSVLRGRDHRARDAFVTDLLAQGPDALGAVVLAFRKEFAAQVDRIGKSNLKKQVDKLATQRQALDEARKHAIELIYDEVKYFYPYKPPAVSAEKAKEYAEVQAEVDRRVASVRAIWNDDRMRLKVPASLQDDLSRLDWVARTLADLGELDAAALAEVEWARALPAGDTVDITSFCLTAAEREQLEDWRRIDAYNAIVGKDVESAEREQLKITNAYRAMFRHRPLALNLKIAVAARGHAEEMSTLGYFAHFSPTPGRRTPFDRMKLAGYDFGVSENIALHDGAQGAHDGWCHSSGHHRNLLHPSHHEFGVGNLGRYWVQNFGGAQQYRETTAWGEAAEKSR